MKNETNILSEEVMSQSLDDLIKKGQSLSELLINTTYLFDTWVCAALPNIVGDNEFLHDGDINLTSDQRFHFFLGCTGAILDKNYGGRLFFNIIRHAYRLKSLMNRVSEAELMKEIWKLTVKFNDIGDEDAPKIDELNEYIPASIIEDREGRPELKYPPENDAEAVEYVRECFVTAMSYCGQYICGYIEEDEETGTEGD